MMNLFSPLALDGSNICKTKGQKLCGLIKERKTCSWFDKNGEKNNESTKKQKK